MSDLLRATDELCMGGRGFIVTARQTPPPRRANLIRDNGPGAIALIAFALAFILCGIGTAL